MAWEDYQEDISIDPTSDPIAYAAMLKRKQDEMGQAEASAAEQAAGQKTFEQAQGVTRNALGLPTLRPALDIALPNRGQLGTTAATAAGADTGPMPDFSDVISGFSSGGGPGMHNLRVTHAGHGSSLADGGGGLRAFRDPHTGKVTYGNVGGGEDLSYEKTIGDIRAAQGRARLPPESAYLPQADPREHETYSAVPGQLGAQMRDVVRQAQRNIAEGRHGTVSMMELKPGDKGEMTPGLFGVRMQQAIDQANLRRAEAMAQDPFLEERLRRGDPGAAQSRPFEERRHAIGRYEQTIDQIDAALQADIEDISRTTPHPEQRAALIKQQQARADAAKKDAERRLNIEVGNFRPSALDLTGLVPTTPQE
jgi:hypothetical protein